MPLIRFHSRRPARNDKRSGYILLTLMLFVSLMVIAAAAAAPSITFRIRRDREEEMIHRGVQYSRAIRHYYKKFGRYPTSIEALEDTNNIHFLRKRYKDPISGKDFKLVHYGEFQMSMGGGVIAGATPVANMGGANASQPLTVQGLTQGMTATVSSGPESSENGPSTSSGDNGALGTHASGSSSDDALTGKTFGGPIIGVVSVSKAQSIREFNHKDHYNEWMFVYDPALDRGGLITTPWQPGLQMAAPNLNSTSRGDAGRDAGQPANGGFGTPAPAPAPPQSAPPTSNDDN